MLAVVKRSFSARATPAKQFTVNTVLAIQSVKIAIIKNLKMKGNAMSESKPKFKVKFDKYRNQFIFGLTFCHVDFGPGPDEKHWIEYYAILHLGKYYLAIGRIG